jgi:hypothetical protein
MNDRHPDAKSLGYRIRLIDLFPLPANITSHRLASFTNEAERETAKMANRKGVFIGAYVPNHLKESLRRRAAAEHRTLSQEITRILEEAVHGKGLPPGSVDRRTRESTPRRRATDPAPRRRNVDVSYTPSGKKSSDENA